MSEQSDTQSLPVSAREVYQVLKDVALELRSMRRVNQSPWGGGDSGRFVITVDGWLITLCTSGDTLNYCDACTAADGRTGSLHNWQRNGTDPVSFLSQWEHQQLERLLRAA